MYHRISRLLDGPSRWFERTIEAPYRRIFSIGEIEREPILQWAFGGLLFFFFVAFDRWMTSPNVTIEDAAQGSAVCWEYFQGCADWYFLHAIGTGYSQTLFYMGLYTMMAFIVYLMWRQRWVGAHALMTVLFVWETLVTFVLTFSHAAPYHYYHIALTAVLLFSPAKEFFLKFVFVFLYFMSVTTKLDGTWVLGTYFTSLRDGIPLFPDVLTLPITNAVIFMQMVGAWFLMSRNMILQRIAFAYFVFFHFYSGVFVTYFYPSVSIPSLLILFGPMYRHTPIPFAWKTVVGWTVVLLLAIFQLLGFMAAGDRRMTLEGNKFGMFMFEANHQCIVTVGTFTKTEPSGIAAWESEPGTACSSFFCEVKRVTQRINDNLFVRESRYESGTAWNRCYPYEWWARYHAACETNANIERVSLRIDHSINGGPFYRIVNTDNICGVPYYPLGENRWITQPPEAPLIGYPVTNTYN